MTENEIIKALEVCRDGYCYMGGCPLAYGSDYDSIEKCTSELRKASLYLINRQKAEIERLTDLINEIGAYNEAWVKDNHDLRVELKTANEEIKELKRQIENIEQEDELKWERDVMMQETP